MQSLQPKSISRVDDLLVQLKKCQPHQRAGLEKKLVEIGTSGERGLLALIRRIIKMNGWDFSK